MKLTAQPYLLASEAKQPMSSSPFNLQSAGVLAENGERYLFVNVNDLFVQEAGGGRIPPCSLGKRYDRNVLLYAIGQAEISSRRWRWLLVVFFFFLQQKESGTR